MGDSVSRAPQRNLAMSRDNVVWSKVLEKENVSDRISLWERLKTVSAQVQTLFHLCLENLLNLRFVLPLREMMFPALD